MKDTFNLSTPSIQCFPLIMDQEDEVGFKLKQSQVTRSLFAINSSYFGGGGGNIGIIGNVGTMSDVRCKFGPW